MEKNKIREKIKNNIPCIGVALSEPSTDFVEIAGILGFDYVMFDTEHTALTPESLKPCFLAAELRGITPFVSISPKDPALILKFLDVGAKGLIFPDVRSVEEAKMLVNAVKYAPEGCRGMRSTRVANWALTASREENRLNANEQTLCLMMIESQEALDKVEEILSVPGVDGTYLGPNDYSVTIGKPGDLKSPEVKAAYEKVIETARKLNIGMLFPLKSPDDLEKVYKRGGRLLTVSPNTMFQMLGKQYMDAYKNIVESLKEEQK